jgi:hypothetical protein
MKIYLQTRTHEYIVVSADQEIRARMRMALICKKIRCGNVYVNGMHGVSIPRNAREDLWYVLREYFAGATLIIDSQKEIQL